MVVMFLLAGHGILQASIEVSIVHVIDRHGRLVAIEREIFHGGMSRP